MNIKCMLLGHWWAHIVGCASTCRNCGKVDEPKKETLKRWTSEYIFNKTIINTKHLVVNVNMRRSNSFMGRFGGGWQYKFGFQTGNWYQGRNTIIIELFVMSVRINLRTSKGYAAQMRYDKEREERIAAKAQLEAQNA